MNLVFRKPSPAQSLMARFPILRLALNRAVVQDLAPIALFEPRRLHLLPRTTRPARPNHLLLRHQHLDQRQLHVSLGLDAAGAPHHPHSLQAVQQALVLAVVLDVEGLVAGGRGRGRAVGCAAGGDAAPLVRLVLVLGR